MATVVKAMSLREAAIHDALLYHGAGAVAELKEKIRQRKWNKRKGIRTNIGDPNRNGNNVKRAKK